MADFEPAFQFMLPHEGGYNFTPGDHGGKTKFGISQAAFPHLDIEHLTLDDARQLYIQHYWSPNYFREIISQDIANKIFDIAVNMSMRSWASIVQEACGDCGVNIVIDGVWGARTRGAVNACNPRQLMVAIRQRQGEHYHRLAEHDPTQAKFLHGWLVRADA
jgi:lysozyme family protein